MPAALTSRPQIRYEQIGLLGHILIGKVPDSERLRWMRTGRLLSASAELLWQLLPPRTFAAEQLVVTALLDR
jgi:hypothetical protein